MRINYHKCVSCGVCVKLCTTGAITISSKGVKISEQCIMCGECERNCPVDAIEMDVSPNHLSEDLNTYKGVAVIVEFDQSVQTPLKVSYELLSKGRELAEQLQEELYAVALCERMPDNVYGMFERIGCERLILFENECFRNYNSEIFANQITEVLKEERPSCVLIPATEDGRDLASAISARLHTGLTADCTALEINEKGELVQIRPTYGGNVIASITTPNSRPQMASVRTNIFPVVESNQTYRMKIIRKAANVRKDKMRIVEISSEVKESIYSDVQEAKLLLIGGYGVGQENFTLLYKIADKLGGAVGATRKAVDEGWAPFEIQIGQTGKATAPEIAVCFGVSGALQHTIGLRKAEKIIAVNHDPNAAIFNMANVAILADCKAIIQQIAKQLHVK